MEVNGVPLFPPPDFVARFNMEPVAAGLPYRTALDPLVMYAWHLATAPASQSPLIVTGI